MELPNKKLRSGYCKVIKNLSVSGTPLYAFSFPNGQHYLTPSPQRKLNGRNALRAPTFQLVFSNAVEFNSEESRIREDAQALKVCSLRAVLYTFWKAEPTVIVLLPSTYVRFPCTILSSQAFSFDWASEITLRLPGTGATSTPTTNGTVSTPIKGGSAMLGVPGLSKDTGAATTAKAAEPGTPATLAPSTTTRWRAAKEEAATAEPASARSADIRAYNFDYNNSCNQTGSDNLDHNSCSNDNPTGRDSSSPDLFHVSFKFPLSITYRPQPASLHNSIYHPIRHLHLLHPYDDATNLPRLHEHGVYILYHDDSTKPSVQSGHSRGYAYGGLGFDAGTVGATPYSVADRIRRTNATHTTATASSVPARYYGTTSTTTTPANPDANANANTVTASAVTKTPARVPLQTFRTVLLATRACGGRLELDTKEGVKAWSAGGGQGEEEGDVKMNEEKGPEVEHEDDGDHEAESSPAKRGVKGKGGGQGQGKVGKPKKVKVAPPPPVTQSTTTVPPVNAASGEENVTVKINNTAAPLRPPISTSTEADDGSDEEEDGDGETLANGKENNKKGWEWDVDVPLGLSVSEISEKGGAVWRVYVG